MPHYPIPGMHRNEITGAWLEAEEEEEEEEGPSLRESRTEIRGDAPQSGTPRPLRKQPRRVWEEEEESTM